MNDPQDTEDDGGTDGPTLRGLETLAVAVEHVLPEAEQAQPQQRDDAFRQQLRHYIEARLREAGVNVWAEEPTPDTAILNLNVSLFRAPFLVAQTAEEVCLFNAVLQLRQSCYLRREPLIWALATTWSMGYLGIAKRSELQGQLQRTIDEHLSRFIRAYESANSPQHRSAGG